MVKFISESDGFVSRHLPRYDSAQGQEFLDCTLYFGQKEAYKLPNSHADDSTQLSMTEFLDDHPGGPDIIKSNKSKDVSPIFKPRHPSDQLEAQNLPPNVYHLGALDVENASEEEKSELRLKLPEGEEDDEERVKRERDAMDERGLGVVVNMKDFEVGPFSDESRGKDSSCK